MDKKTVSAVRRQLKPAKNVIDRIYTCYCDESGDVIMMQTTSKLGSLSEESSELYHKILGKTLSGKIGKNLFNLSFPLEDDAESTQHLLYELNRNQTLENVDAFFHRIINTYEFVGQALIILAHGTWDIPARERDDAPGGEGESEGVYEFCVCSICPVLNAAEGLAYDPDKTLFTEHISRLATRPDAGFLFPAFHAGTGDIHSCLYFSRRPDEVHPELVTDFLGCALPASEDTQAEVFRELIADGLGNNRTLENITGVYDSVTEIAESSDDEDMPPEIGEVQIERVLRENGADDEGIGRFKESFADMMGESRFLGAENVSCDGKVTVKSPGYVVSIRPEFKDLVRTRTEDGLEYLVLPLSEATVNGIPVAAGAFEK